MIFASSSKIIINSLASNDSLILRDIQELFKVITDRNDFLVVDGEISIHSIEKVIQKISVTKSKIILVVNITKASSSKLLKLLSAGIRYFINEEIVLLHGKKILNYLNTGLSIVPERLLTTIAELADSLSANKLTERELETLTLVCKGYSNKNIAQYLHVSLSTLKTHISNLNQKLNSKNRKELIAKAYAAKLVPFTLD